MPLSELTELVTRLDGASLDVPAEASELVRRIEQVGALLERVGAASSAAQLALAASLVQRASRRGGEEGDDVRQTVRTLLSTVERAFHLAPPPVEGARARPAAAVAERESHRAMAETQLRLLVARDMLLGEMLVHFGVVAQADLEEALALQQGTQKRLGEILVEHGFTSQADIKLALEYQKCIRAVARPPAPTTKRAPAPPLPQAEKRAAPLRMATELLLGEILVLQGVITRKQLEHALALQRKSGQMLGETLLRSRRVTRHQLESALTMQGSRRRSRTRKAH